MRSREQATKQKTEIVIEEDSNTDDFRGGGILQLRPSFSSLNAVSENEDMEVDGESDQLKKVTAKRQTKKQEKLKNWQKNTYEYQKKEFEAEPFVNLNYMHYNNYFECHDRLKLLYSDDDNESEPLTIQPAKYLDYVVGEARQPIPVTIPYGVCSRSKRETLALPPQLVQLMRSVVVMHYSDIKQLISIRSEDSEIITNLQSIALPIDGVWVVRR